MKEKIFDYLIKILVIFTIVLGILAWIKPELIKSFIEWVQGIIELLGYWNYIIIFFSSLIEAFPVLGVVMPGQNIMIIVGGFFALQGKDYLLYAIIVSSIGAMLGNFIGYEIGKHHGDGFFKKYGMWFGLGLTEVKYLKKGVKTWGPFGIILGKFHNVARAFLPFIAGGMGMHKASFHIYNVIGSIIRAVTMILLGVLFAQYYETIIDYISWIFLVLMLVFVGYMYFFRKEDFMRYMEDKNNEIDQMIQQDYEKALKQRK